MSSMSNRMLERQDPTRGAGTGGAAVMAGGLMGGRCWNQVVGMAANPHPLIPHFLARQPSMATAVTLPSPPLSTTSPSSLLSVLPTAPPPPQNTPEREPRVQRKRTKPKARRACIHCQKAHATCDNNRPCNRCIRRGCADTCVDAPRKKAKYLDDVPYSALNTGEMLSSASQKLMCSIAPRKLNIVQPTPPSQIQQPFLPLSAPVGSANAFPGFVSKGLPSVMVTADDSNTSNDFLSSSFQREYDTLSNLISEYQKMTGFNVPLPNPPVPPLPMSTQQQQEEFEVTPEMISKAYASVVKPYPLAGSFEQLLTFAQEEMRPDDLARINNSLAKIRPVSINIIKTMTEEDLVFKEKWFQRILLEQEKLISISGTPCCCWRRTGEVCIIGKEMSLLTGWDLDQSDGKIYMHNLMDHASIVQYWECYSTIAMNNETKSCEMPCTLLSKNGQKVQYVMSFTVKRCAFDIPIVVIAHFLPNITNTM